MHALLIAQDSDEVAILSLVLQRVGMTVGRAAALERLLQTGPEHPADFVVLASRENPPAAQVRRFRAQAQVPLMVITGPIEEESQIELLNAGVDLVISRPYSTRLLISQVRALQRRAGGVPFFTLPTLSIGGLTLDPAARTVQLAEAPPRRLTHLEFRLLYTLMIHQGQILPADTLVEHVWGYTGEGDRDLVRGLVSRLRAKVEGDPRNPAYIITVPGVGYLFSNLDNSAE
ncbi:MAG: response regulator transcription factor [Anaerolineae bacterium]|nr:response regulator transcription factor [Anaerolineae bacterium]